MLVAITAVLLAAVLGLGIALHLSRRNQKHLRHQVSTLETLLYERIRNDDHARREKAFTAANY